MNNKPLRKAVFPVAGLGTRLKPLTDTTPKEMLEVSDKPLIQYAVDEAHEAGIEEFIFVTGAHNKHILEDYFKDAPGTHHFTNQDQPLGLGHAIWCAKDLISDEPFAVLLPDVLIQGQKGCLSQMAYAHEEKGGNIIAVNNVSREETSKYGIADIDETNRIKGLVEKPAPEEAPSTLAVTGRYILQPELFKYLAEFETGAGGEIQLTDAMAKLTEEQEFYASEFEGTIYDCGSLDGLSTAREVLGDQEREAS